VEIGEAADGDPRDTVSAAHASVTARLENRRRRGRWDCRIDGDRCAVRRNRAGIAREIKLLCLIDVGAIWYRTLAVVGIRDRYRPTRRGGKLIDLDEGTNDAGDHRGSVEGHGGIGFDTGHVEHRRILRA